MFTVAWKQCPGGRDVFSSITMSQEIFVSVGCFKTPGREKGIQCITTYQIIWIYLHS